MGYKNKKTEQIHPRFQNAVGTLICLIWSYDLMRKDLYNICVDHEGSKSRQLGSDCVSKFCQTCLTCPNSSVVQIKRWKNPA